jgi:hypothetical protein
MAGPGGERVSAHSSIALEEDTGSCSAAPDTPSQTTTEFQVVQFGAGRVRPAAEAMAASTTRPLRSAMATLRTGSTRCWALPFSTDGCAAGAHVLAAQPLAVPLFSGPMLQCVLPGALTALTYPGPTQGYSQHPLVDSLFFFVAKSLLCLSGSLHVPRLLPGALTVFKLI